MKVVVAPVYAKAHAVRLRLVTSRGSPYPSRSPRAHPSDLTRTRLRVLVCVDALGLSSSELFVKFASEIFLRR